jgi:hypothetical protein
MPERKQDEHDDRGSPSTRRCRDAADAEAAAARTRGAGDQSAAGTRVLALVAFRLVTGPRSRDTGQA